jgi:hypothetical protein
MFAEMGDADSSSLPSPRVWQAQEIVARQAACALYRALELTMERARNEGSTLEDVAAGVVFGRITFRA